MTVPAGRIATGTTAAARAVASEPVEHQIIEVDRVPITLGGLARHNVANALAAAGAARGLGVTLAQLRDGLTDFQPSSERSPGRLNLFRLGSRVVIIDFAHNEAGVTAILDVAEGIAGGAAGRAAPVTAIIGTAGDRPDDTLRGIGRIAGQRAQRVAIKETLKYLRGRSRESIVGEILAGVRSAGRSTADVTVYESETAALRGELARSDGASRPDGPKVIVLMCHEEREEVFAGAEGARRAPGRHRQRAHDAPPPAPDPAAPRLTGRPGAPRDQSRTGAQPWTSRRSANRSRGGSSGSRSPWTATSAVASTSPSAGWSGQRGVVDGRPPDPTRPVRREQPHPVGRPFVEGARGGRSRSGRSGDTSPRSGPRGRSGSSRTETYRTSSPSRRDRIRAWTYGRWKTNRAPRTVGHDIASRLRNQTPGRPRCRT